MTSRMTIHRHEALLRRHGLDSLNAIRDLKVAPFKVYPGRRDVIRLKLESEAGQPPVVLFVKRNWVPYPKHALASLVRFGRVIGFGEWEARNLLTLERHGISASPCVASGAEISGLNERFSFVISEAAPGMALDDWLAEEPDDARRRTVSNALAAMLRRVHDHGFALPTLLARHVFVEFDPQDAASPPRLTLIDIDRLHWRPILPRRRRAKDLAHLQLSVPVRVATRTERIRFLYAYGRKMAKRLLPMIQGRAAYLLRRRPERSEPFLRGLREEAVAKLHRQAQLTSRRSHGYRIAVNCLIASAVLFGVYCLDAFIDSQWFEERIANQADNWLFQIIAFHRAHSHATISASLTALFVAITAILVVRCFGKD